MRLQALAPLDGKIGLEGCMEEPAQGSVDQCPSPSPALDELQQRQDGTKP